MTYRDLTVWQKGMDLAVEVYRIIKLLPREEQYVLSDQMRRASVSIPSNIAEGWGRDYTKDFIRFLNIARGSEYELETQLLLCTRIGLVSENDIENAMNMCDEIGKMLNAMIKKLAAKADATDLNSET